MASGRAHDRATSLLALPFGLLWGPGLGLEGIAVASLAFLLGGLWLSPDLDTPSRVTARWGPLRGLWWPYRRLLRHRSLLSHSPLIGTAGRLAYLLTALAVLRWLAGAWPLAWPALARRTNGDRGSTPGGPWGADPRGGSPARSRPRLPLGPGANPRLPDPLCAGGGP
ncbi:MAG: DUF2227 family putative metal-binding protein [Cyanobacteriota bacterium]